MMGPGATAVSVVVATYNRAALVTRALDSVVRQTEPPAEIIVVDDASTDETLAVVRAWAGRAPLPLRLVAATANRGAGAARNRGIEAASGELVAFLDSDDEYRPSALAALAAPLRQHREAVVSFADAEVVFADGSPAHRHVARHLSPAQGVSPTGTPGLFRLDDPQAHLLTTSFIPTCSAMFRREAARRVGGMPEARFGEDWLFWLRLTEEGEFLCQFDDVAIVHRQADNLTGGANDLANSRRVLDALREVRAGRHVALDRVQKQTLDLEIATQEKAWRYFASRGGVGAYWDALGQENDRLTQLRRDPRSLLRALVTTIRGG